MNVKISTFIKSVLSYSFIIFSIVAMFIGIDMFNQSQRPTFAQERASIEASDKESIHINKTIEKANIAISQANSVLNKGH